MEETDDTGFEDTIIILNLREQLAEAKNLIVDLSNALEFVDCNNPLIDKTEDYLNACNHEWISMKNEVIESGLMCKKCKAIK